MRGHGGVYPGEMPLCRPEDNVTHLLGYKVQIMKKFVLALLVCCCLSGVTGCVTKLADVTVISTKNIDLQNSLHTVDMQRWVTGIDREYMILLFPTGKVDMEEALNDAQDKAGCVALANATITSCFWYIPYIYGQMRYEVTGNPVYESSPAVPTSKVNPEPPPIPEEQR